jgi:metal-sulfur cluster biosynthetic enzyme
MVTNEQVYEVLRKCYDPEIPVSLVDLGLIYDVQIEDDHVKVVMTLTARGCPAHSFISEQVRQQVAEPPERGGKKATGYKVGKGKQGTGNRE